MMGMPLLHAHVRMLEGSTATLACRGTIDPTWTTSACALSAKPQLNILRMLRML